MPSSNRFRIASRCSAFWSSSLGNALLMYFPRALLEDFPSSQSRTASEE